MSAYLTFVMLVVELGIHKPSINLLIPPQNRCHLGLGYVWNLLSSCRLIQFNEIKQEYLGYQWIAFQKKIGIKRTLSLSNSEMLENGGFGLLALMFHMSPLNEKKKDSLIADMLGKGKNMIVEENFLIRGNAFVRGEPKNSWDFHQERNQSTQKISTSHKHPRRVSSPFELMSNPNFKAFQFKSQADASEGSNLKDLIF